MEVHFIIAACENMVAGAGLRPGDILTSASGACLPACVPACMYVRVRACVLGRICVCDGIASPDRSRLFVQGKKRNAHVNAVLALTRSTPTVYVSITQVRYNE